MDEMLFDVSMMTPVPGRKWWMRGRNSCTVAMVPRMRALTVSDHVSMESVAMGPEG